MTAAWRLTWRPTWRRHALTGAAGLFGGVLSAASIPPFGFWPLAIVGTALLYCILSSAPPRQRLGAGFAFGIGFFGIGYAWVLDLAAGGWIALTLFESAVTALACLAVPGSGPGRRGFRGPLAFTTALLLADAFRWWWPFGGIPIGSLALGQAAAPLGQLARMGGPLLVEAGILVLGACIGALALRLTRPGAAMIARSHSARPVEVRPGKASGLQRTGVLGPIVLAASTLAVCGAGYAAPAGGPARGQLRVAAVQGGGVRGLHAIFTDSSVVYDRQLNLTLTRVSRPHLDLVIWPEDVIALDGPLANSLAAEQVGGAARQLDTTLVAGVTETVGSSRFLNEAVAWAPTGSIIGTYEKVHRVPFGEYIPFRSFFSHFGPTGLVPRDAIPGRGPGILATPPARLGVMISFEVFYPGRAAAAVSHGATLLVVPTNDASYSTGQVPAQEVAADRLRAIEEGRDLIQSAPTGYTDVVDNRGRLLGRTSLGVPAVLERVVQLRTGRTWYSETGEGPVIGLALAILALVWATSMADRSRMAPPVVAAGEADRGVTEEARLA